MKLTKQTDLVAFLKTVNCCEGDVYFSSVQGDHLNLKSVLSQYLFSVAAGDREFLLTGEIVCEDEADARVLLPYLSEGMAEDAPQK